MPKIEKALRREKQQFRKKYGMRVTGRSVKLLVGVIRKKGLDARRTDE